MTNKIYERDGENVYHRDFGAPANTREILTEQVDSLDIMQNDIYGVTDIIVEDTLMLSRLRALAIHDKEDSELFSRIADRFESLTTTAHNRKHWTGKE